MTGLREVQVVFYDINFVQTNLNVLSFLNANQSKSAFNSVKILRETCPLLRYPQAKPRQ